MMVSSSGPKPRVLFVDDDAATRSALQRLLRAEFDVDACADGAEALRMMMRGEPYDVVIADYEMPFLNGVDFLRLARENVPCTRRILMTGSGDQDAILDAVMSAELSGVLYKPAASCEICAAVAAAAAEGRAARVG